MKQTNTFRWTRLLQSMIALMVILSMLLCGCAGANTDEKDEGKGNTGGGGNNAGLLGDGDGKLETEDVVGSFTGIYGTLLDAIGGNKETATGYEMEMSLVLGDVLMDQLNDMLEQEGMDFNMSWFKSLGMQMVINYVDDMIGMDMTAKLNDTDIASLKAVLDIAGGMGYIGLPDLNDQYVGMPLDMGDIEEAINGYQSAMAQLEEYADIVNALPSEKTLNALINRYISTAKGAMRNPTTSNETLSYGGVSMDVTASTYEINRTDILNILEAVLNEAKSDKDLEKIIDDLVAWVNEKASEQDPSWEEVDVHAQMIQAIEDFLPELEELREELKNGEVEDLTMLSFTVYTAGEKQVGYRLMTDDGWDTMEAYIYFLENSGKTAFVLNVGGQMEIGGTGTKSGDLASGTYTITMDGREMLTFSLKDFDTKALKKGELKGTIQLKLTEDMLDEMHGPNMLLGENTVIELALDMSGNSNKMSIALLNGDDVIIRINVSSKILSGGSVKVPSNYADPEDSKDMQNWASGMSFDKILSNLRKAGVSSELMDMLEDALDQMN